MRKLGISLYPQYGTEQQQFAYLELASSYGFTRMFTCLMSAGDDNSNVQLAKVVKKAVALGFEVIADVSPDVFAEKNISYKELAYFKNLGLSGLRLDLGFSGMEESIMSFNEHGLSIELNMSQGTKYLEQVLSCQPNKEKIIGCHNFYPRQYTGLSRQHFLTCSKQYKEQGIRTAAMISSSEAKYGPWPVQVGLPTLEEHRHLPIHIQAKDLFQTNLIDDVIIGNAFASEEELKNLASIDRHLLELAVTFNDNIYEIEKRIIAAKNHFNRGDVSAYVIRSTQTRVNFKNEDIPSHTTGTIQRGSVTIDNSLSPRYKGELQIALQEMENNGSVNNVATVVKEEQFLLDQMMPWQKFKLIEKKS